MATPADRRVALTGRKADSNIFRSCWRSVMALIIREMSTTYGRHPIGFVWMFLEPLGAVLILALAFSFAFNTPPLGDSFSLFYASGYLPYLMYTETQKRVSHSIGFSRALLKYPRVTILDSIIARGILSFLTMSIVSAIIIVLVLLVFQSSRNIDFGQLLLSFTLAFALGQSIGMVNCFMFTRIPFWKPVWGIINRPLFIVSGVFFIYEMLPTALQDVLWYNPVFHIVGMTRTAFYPNYDPTYTSIPFVLGLSIVFMTVGILLLSVLARDYVED